MLTGGPQRTPPTSPAKPPQYFLRMSVKNVVRLALLALVATPSLLSAQDTSRTQRALDALGQTAKPGTYSGTVRDSALRPIVDAEVFLSGDSEERSLLTNTSGMFVFSDLAPGRYTIFVRRLGYQPQQRVVYIATGERHSTLIQLVALPMHLPDVEVRAKSGMNLSPALERMYRTACLRPSRSPRGIRHQALALRLPTSTRAVSSSSGPDKNP